jgi:hypothetical protein
VNAITLLLICGSVWFCFQLIAVLVCWRFTRIRPTLESALRDRIAEPGFGDDVWAGLDRAMAERWDDVDALVDAINEDHDKAHFELWENEFRERAS